MIITVASFKGGVGKTTTAVHIASYLQTKAPTLLVDGDLNRSALEWAKFGKLPFKVVDERQAVRFARDFQHIVIDTGARPNQEDLKTLVDGCDLLVIPTTPDALALSALKLTIKALNDLGASSYRILLTMIAPKPNRDGEEARLALTEVNLPVFSKGISRLVAFQKAALSGVIVSQINDPRSRQAWLEYEEIGKELPV